MYTVDNFINGKSNTASKNSSIIVNPSYGKEIGKVLYATDESLNLAVETSLKAFNTWSQTGLSFRAELMLEFRQELINGIIDQECLFISKNLLKNLDKFS